MIRTNGTRALQSMYVKFLILHISQDILKHKVLRANPYKNQTKSQMSGKAQKIKFALLLHGGSP